MRQFDADAVRTGLPYADLIEALREMFREGCEAPTRHHHDIAVPNAADATLLLMPAWRSGAHIGIKVVTVFPSNGARDLPGVMGNYMLLDGTTGMPEALIEGQTLTARRTAAASALASDYLSRKDASRLLMVGTGALVPGLIEAHAAVRPIKNVTIWGRRLEKAQALADDISLPGAAVRATADLQTAVGEADIISCATLSPSALIEGAWLRPGQHLDLVGAFRPDMRESDDEAVQRSRIFVDTFDGAFSEAGDIVQPLAAGIIKRSSVIADLRELTTGAQRGRQTAEEITLFKSVGTALEDLAAAVLLLERAE